MTEIGYLHRKAEDAARIPELLIHATNITDGAVRLYGHMWWRYQTCGYKNREPAGSMAKALGVSEKTIRNRIMELELSDWLVVVEIDFDKETGKYQTPFYHVFEVQEECRQFRAMYQPKEGERITPKPEPKKARTRKTREGVGGNPNLRNSSSGGDTCGTQVPGASRDRRNSSSDKKESYISTDSVEYESTDNASANADAVPPLKVVKRVNPWYDVVLEVWDYTEQMNGAMQKMLQGKATDKAWVKGNVSVPLEPGDVRAWAAWYRKTELNDNPKLNMLEDRMKIASSISRWHHIGRPRIDTPKVIVAEPSPEEVDRQTDSSQFRRYDANGNFIGFGREESA